MELEVREWEGTAAKNVRSARKNSRIRTRLSSVPSAERRITASVGLTTADAATKTCTGPASNGNRLRQPPTARILTKSAIWARSAPSAERTIPRTRSFAPAAAHRLARVVLSGRPAAPRSVSPLGSRLTRTSPSRAFPSRRWRLSSRSALSPTSPNFSGWSGKKSLSALTGSPF